MDSYLVPNQCRFPPFLKWIHILFPISADFPPSSNGFISCSQSVPISPLPQMDSYLVPNQCRFPPFLKWIHILFPISADFPPSSNGFISCSQSMPISPLPQLDSYLVPNECRFPPFLKWIHVENRSCNGTLFHSNKQCRYQNEGNLQNTEANYSRFRAKHGLMTPFVWFQYMGTWSNLKKGPTRAI
jgi:hypothetical protein